MDIIGKCPPTPPELSAAAERGFDAVEIYLERHHLDEFEDTLAALLAAPTSIRAIHTPHVEPDELEYIELTDDLAFEFDASVVVHSGHIDWSHIDAIEDLELRSPYGYENDIPAPPEKIEDCVFARGQKLVFDVAHFALSVDEDPAEKIENFLTMYGTEIEVIHLCDADETEGKDGVPIGEGTLDMEAIAHATEQNYRGPVTIEVMPDEQAASWEKVREYLAVDVTGQPTQ